MSSGSAGPVSGSAEVTRRLRVLYLVGQLGYGGSEGQLQSVAMHLDRSAWEPHVIVFHSSPNADHVAELQSAGIGVRVMPGTVRGPLGKLAFTAREARRLRPDVIHSWTVHDNPYAAWGGRLASAPVRWGSLRGSTSLPGFRSLPGWYRRAALRSVQRVVVNSQALVDELQELGLARPRVMLLPNCVEPSLQEGDGAGACGLEELGFAAGEMVFGSIGNIRRAKNQALFVRALARVIAQRPQARGVIVGETLAGEEATRAELDREIERLGVGGKIILAGFRPDVRRLMRGMAAVCQTSNSEGMPNVVLEAMAEGVPVIATAVGGVPEVVRRGETGHLVPPGDEAAFAEAMLKVLDEPAEAFRMVIEARELVSEERSCALAARRVEAAYREALERAAGA